jgi:hypothetical protein
MDNKLNYQQARRIRGQSLSDLFAEQLISGSDFIPGFKKSIGLKTQARVKGIKEKFDPLNIAKFMTGGSRIGPAILGKILGRSRKDIEYFAGRARPVGNKARNIAGIPSDGESMTGLKAGLSKVLKVLNETRDNDLRLSEKENNFREEKEDKDKRRHDKMMEALKALIGKTEINKIDTEGKGLMDFFGDLKDKLKQRAADKAEKKAAEIATKKAAEEAVKVTEKAGVTAAVGVTETAVKNAAGHVATDAVVGKAEQATAEKLTKTAVTKAEETAIKDVAEKVVVKGAASSLLKKIPLGIGLLFAAPDIWGRIKEGDLAGATLATASPLASAIPFVGTAAGVGLDLVDMTRQVYGAVYPNSRLEQDLINDPELTKKRLSFIGSVLQPMVQKILPKSEQQDDSNITSFNPETGEPMYQPKQNKKSPPAAPAAKPAPSAAPVSEPPKSDKLSSVTETNNNLNLDSKVAQSAPVSTTTNVEAPSKLPGGFKPQIGFASVRNQDDTFQRLMVNSTRVV